jgi:hypothetical protein
MEIPPGCKTPFTRRIHEGLKINALFEKHGAKKPSNKNNEFVQPDPHERTDKNNELETVGTMDC